MRLDSGDRFPTIRGTTLDGNTIAVPDDLDLDWKVLLFYRGHF